MEIVKEVDLLSYWMPVLKQLKEFKEIAKAEEPELRYILKACDFIISNFFITTAGEYGISRYEKILGIFPDEGEDLETRRFNVLFKWNDKLPYTDEVLYNRLLSLCGKDKFSITPHYGEYAIDIKTEVGTKGAFDAITKLILEMLPCNLVLTLANFIKAQKTTLLNVGVAISTAMSYQITNDINKEYIADNPLNLGVGLSRAGINLITHDADFKNSLNANVINAVGAGVATTVIITNDIDSTANITGNSTTGTIINTASAITIKS